MEAMIYVSVTGLRLASPWRAPLFWLRAASALFQARQAPGNLLAEMRRIDGVYHTLSVWRSSADMRAYLTAGAHLAAMKSARTIGPGATCGYEAEAAPTWEEALAYWRAHGRDTGYDPDRA